MKLFIYGLLLSILFVNTGCPGKSCIEATYSFVATSRFVSLADSLQIGDTLFLVSKIPYKLTDMHTGSSIDYSNAQNIGSDLVITELAPNSELKNAVGSF